MSSSPLNSASSTESGWQTSLPEAVLSSVRARTVAVPLSTLLEIPGSIEPHAVLTFTEMVSQASALAIEIDEEDQEDDETVEQIESILRSIFSVIISRSIDEVLPLKRQQQEQGQAKDDAETSCATVEDHVVDLITQKLDFHCKSNEMDIDSIGFEDLDQEIKEEWIEDVMACLSLRDVVYISEVSISDLMPSDSASSSSDGSIDEDNVMLPEIDIQERSTNSYNKSLFADVVILGQKTEKRLKQKRKQSASDESTTNSLEQAEKDRQTSDMGTQEGNNQVKRSGSNTGLSTLLGEGEQDGDMEDAVANISTNNELINRYARSRSNSSNSSSPTSSPKMKRGSRLSGSFRETKVKSPLSTLGSTNTKARPRVDSMTIHQGGAYRLPRDLRKRVMLKTKEMNEEQEEQTEEEKEEETGVSSNTGDQKKYLAIKQSWSRNRADSVTLYQSGKQNDYLSASALRKAAIQRAQQMDSTIEEVRKEAMHQKLVKPESEALAKDLKRRQRGLGQRVDSMTLIKGRGMNGEELRRKAAVQRTMKAKEDMLETNQAVRVSLERDEEDMTSSSSDEEEEEEEEEEPEVQPMHRMKPKKEYTHNPMLSRRSRVDSAVFYGGGQSVSSLRKLAIARATNLPLNNDEDDENEDEEDQDQPSVQSMHQILKAPKGSSQKAHEMTQNAPTIRRLVRRDSVSMFSGAGGPSLMRKAAQQHAITFKQQEQGSSNAETTGNSNDTDVEDTTGGMSVGQMMMARRSGNLRNKPAKMGSGSTSTTIGTSAMSSSASSTSEASLSQDTTDSSAETEVEAMHQMLAQPHTDTSSKAARDAYRRKRSDSMMLFYQGGQFIIMPSAHLQEKAAEDVENEKERSNSDK